MRHQWCKRASHTATVCRREHAYAGTNESHKGRQLRTAQRLDEWGAGAPTKLKCTRAASAATAYLHAVRTVRSLPPACSLQAVCITSIHSAARPLVLLVLGVWPGSEYLNGDLPSTHSTGHPGPTREALWTHRIQNSPDLNAGRRPNWPLVVGCWQRDRARRDHFMSGRLERCRSGTTGQPITLRVAAAITAPVVVRVKSMHRIRGSSMLLLASRGSRTTLTR